ncbi:probable External NADH-ubiquinone oxidoreductase 1, mitochondrial [Saccharomycodes ludwigii]|uniref:NADH:ubiquinone reductase (non-electrogenic) n=1 Tax=Saccharomycodes ludwigii TaxID=36035 RepID=A0A376B3D1_9ASCO|nr:hypothetical protein SCDLUD_002686 [Saccharomycodes ludwigii]KAH3901200.1 hypothetical protein SCDLUD_002686 [Saccharomycodes ludwigii]SSD59196.1 probable External NADH-ubiquinone oxidoreductase 1, mitochondrial [Saccharomycodes ludwigii]
MFKSVFAPNKSRSVMLSKNLTKAFRPKLYSTAATAKKSSFFSKAKSILLYSTLFTTVGTISYFSYELYEESHPPVQVPQAATFKNGSPKKNLVILGSGWGSVTLLKNLDTSLYNVTVVSPRNYFLFTPLLPSTPVGTVELKSIIEPVRSICRRAKGEVLYLDAEATDIDIKNKKVTVSNEKEGLLKDLPYDYLVVGVGAQSTTFGIPGVFEHASFLKEITDAQSIRSKIMNNIEKAATLSLNDPERKRLLSFVVVGGGPTGVEFAAELQDYVDQDLRKWIPELSKEINVTLVEALPNILNMFDKSLVGYAQDLFAKHKINLKLKTMVKNVDDSKIEAKCDGESIEIPYGVLVWATGNAPRPFAKKIMQALAPVQNNRRGLLINDKLQLLGVDDGSIFAIGDCTFHKGLFPTAQVAHEEGEYLADVLQSNYAIDQLKFKISQNRDNVEEFANLSKSLISLEASIKNFNYIHAGALAYIGNDKAIADLAIGQSKYRWAGAWTFWFWKGSYLAMCMSFKNRMLIALDWMKVQFIGRDSSV